MRQPWIGRRCAWRHWNDRAGGTARINSWNEGTLDWRLFSAINRWAGRWPALDQLAVLAAQYLPFVLVVFLAAVWFTGERPAERERRQYAIIYAASGTLLAYAVTLVTRNFIARARPFVDHQVNQLIPHVNDSSFPSDHSILAFAIVASLLVVSRKLGFVALALALTMGLARVFAGIHYPGDIAGGGLLGAAMTLVVWRFDPLPRRAIAPLLLFARRFRLA